MIILKNSILHMFEFYFNFINYGEFKVQSFDTLIKHHFHLPKIDSTLFFGNGQNSQSNLGSMSDVYFVRQIYGIGFFGLSIYLVLYFYMLIASFAYIKKSEYFFEFSLVWFITFISSFKGSYIFSSYIGDCVLILFLCCVLSKNLIIKMLKVIHLVNKKTKTSVITAFLGCLPSVKIIFLHLFVILLN